MQIFETSFLYARIHSSIKDIPPHRQNRSVMKNIQGQFGVLYLVYRTTYTELYIYWIHFFCFLKKHIAFTGILAFKDSVYYENNLIVFKL